MRRLKMITWVAAAAVMMTACGGNGLVGSPTTKGGTGGSSATAITVASSVPQISTDGTVTATITATLKDASNNLVPNATVTFGSTAGALAVTQATTTATGQATATLSGQGVASGTTITVTATSGTLKGMTTVGVSQIQQTLKLTTNQATIPSDGSKQATITAQLLDAANNVVPGATVSFGAAPVAPATGNVALTVTQAVTGANGTATATLGTAGDQSTRMITVTASAGAATATPLVIGETGSTLSISGPSALTLNGTGTYVVALDDSAGSGIAGKAVTLTSSLGNTITPATTVTTNSGQLMFTVNVTKSGTDTITAAALGVTSSTSVAISAQNFAFTTPAPGPTPTNVDLTSTTTPVHQTLAVLWTVSGVPQANQAVTFTTTRGTLSALTAMTDATGTATVTISSTVAGPATVQATVNPASGALTTQTQLEFVATDPSVIDLQASPTTIPKQGTSTLTAVVRDASNNLVQFQTVNFQTVNDITGGTLSAPSAVTDLYGRAQTVYTASTTTSATNGVVVQATVQGTSISTTASLTVGGQAVGLSLGTGNTLFELPAGCGPSSSTLCTQFEVQYSVLATDAGGNPVTNVPVTMTVHAVNYYKGSWNVSVAPNAHYGLTAGYNTDIGQQCLNEDASEFTDPSANYNGVLDPGEDGCTNGVTPTGVTVAAPYICNPTGNQNGKLDPGSTAVASPGTVTTDSTGTATFNIIYPESIATWVDVELIASTNVSGTESSASTTFNLPIKASYISSIGDSPPGALSPYGVVNLCTNPN